VFVSPNILLEPASPGNKFAKSPEYLSVAGKHCTLTLHVKAADFRLSNFLSAVRKMGADTALLRTECVAMQRDAAPRIVPVTESEKQENSETNLPSMLLGWGWRRRHPIRAGKANR
jgi:hypothetical protein